MQLSGKGQSMKRRKLNAATGILLTAGVVISTVVPPAGPASADTDKDLFSQFSTVSREYDSVNDGLVRYHYVDENGDAIDLDSSPRSRFFSKKAVNVPSAYDLRMEDGVTPIKDQGVTGSCWAFAAIKSLESNQIIKKQQTADSIDLSESHLSWYTYHPSFIADDLLYGEGIQTPGAGNTSAYMDGGNSVLAAFTLARWSGAVKEESAPFTADNRTELNTMANGMAKKSDSLHYQNDYKLTDAICYDNASLEQVKSAIMENGAMSVAFYYEPKFDHQSADKDIAYYQEKFTGKNAIDQANHCVTIIGWDDNYSRENFGSYKPSSNGAWLIANSYGDDFGKEGYFWMSYEEPSLTEYYSFISTTADTYDNNYQYDGFGWGDAVALRENDKTKAANIFRANAGFQQTLKAVGMYTVSDNQPYTIKIYRHVKAGKPTSGTLAATISGTQEFEGYHTVAVPQPVSLNAGERFSVVIIYDSTNDDNGFVPLEGESYHNFSYNLSYQSNLGESYLYAELSNNKWGWLDVSQYGKNNVCLKAFTTNGQPVGSVSFKPSKVTLGENETYTANPSIKDITDKSLSWKSSDKNIASVSKKGKVTARKAGTATITAVLASGRSGSFQVIVKKAPSKITVSPKRKMLRLKKSFQIKTSLPLGSASNQISYTSSNSAVAKVNAFGKVTGRKKGTAVITVKTFNKKKAIITVVVR